MRPSISAFLAMTAAVATSYVSAQEPIQSLYVPLPEQELYTDVFRKIRSSARAPIKSLISISISTDGTIIYYDHWEDGYDSDVTGNKQSSTEVWGDGDKSNGCAPIVDANGNREPCTDENDILLAGDVSILSSTIKLYGSKYDRRSSEVAYDGGDHIQATRPVAMTRAAYPKSPGSLMAGAVEVIEEANWGTSFEAPIGTDVGRVRDVNNKWVQTYAYQLSKIAVMAGDDNTVVYNNGKAVGTLDQGESMAISVKQSDKITTSKPVQAHLITGDINSTYELRWYYLAPTDNWYKEAYAPVGDTKGTVRVTVYNPNNSEISVQMSTPSGTITFKVDSQKHAISPVIVDGSAAKFISNDNFYAFSSTDTASSGQLYDWGYPLVGVEQLTEQVIIGLGYGCTENDCDKDGERSIVWVTPVEDADIHIDYNNDGTVDDTVSARALQSIEFTDDNDEDMSGANIWATNANGEGVKIAAAWGQKAALSKSGDGDALDLGTVVVPFQTTRTSCSVSLLEDRDGDKKISVGDVVEQKIEVINVGQLSLVGKSLAVETPAGPVVVDGELGGRGDSQVYKVSYTVPQGYDVLGNCDLLPYEAPPSKAPTDGPTASPTDAPTSAPTEAPKTSPPAPDAPSVEDRTTDKAFTKGDPHFKTFGGELYDYHGECDLVLLHNPDFKKGLGMDIHIRTKIEAFWSSVESAVIKLGDETLEIKADPESNEWLWFNGQEVTSDMVDGKWIQTNLAGFLVRYKQTGPNTREANLYLKGSKEYLILKTFKSFVRVDVNWKHSENYYNSVGLLGSHAHQGQRLGRNGKFIENANAFGQEWQVRPAVDGSLFHSYEGAVVGKKCKMPPMYQEGEDSTVAALRGRRLGASALDTAKAEEACNHLVDPEEKKACVFDVLATQDLSMASTW